MCRGEGHQHFTNMAMLAAPRRKQKFSIDPRGSSWSKDENKFGQKMLEKMGWSKGQGLGANEDGRVDHVKISLKDDTRGVGCKKSQADNWIAHQDDFDSLLATLNQVYVNDEVTKVDKPEVMNLEEKSKAAKSRIHYQKFIKSKDLSSRKMEDLDCIFGRRKSKKEKKMTLADDIVTDDKTQITTESKTESFGVQTFHSSDNMRSYFAKKMAKIEDPQLTEENEEETDNKATADGELMETFGGQKTSSESYQSYFEKKMFKLNARKANNTSEHEIKENIPSETETTLNANNSLTNSSEDTKVETPKKKSKKRKRKKHGDDETIESAELSENLRSIESLDDTSSISKKTVRFSDPIFSVFVEKPGNFSDSLEEDEAATTTLENVTMSVSDSCVEVEKSSKKKSKKRKKQKTEKSATEQENSKTVTEEKSVIFMEENSVNITEENSVNITEENSASFAEEVESPSKKKNKSKKKDRSREVHCDADNFEKTKVIAGQKSEVTMETRLVTMGTDTPFEKKGKTSRKRKLKTTSNDEQAEPKKSKKKSPKKHFKQNLLIQEEEISVKIKDRNFPDNGELNDSTGEIETARKTEDASEDKIENNSSKSIEAFIERKRQEELERRAAIDARRSIELLQRFVGSNIDKIPGYSKNQTYLHLNAS